MPIARLLRYAHIGLRYAPELDHGAQCTRVLDAKQLHQVCGNDRDFLWVHHLSFTKVGKPTVPSRQLFKCSDRQADISGGHLASERRAFFSVCSILVHHHGGPVCG